MALFGTCFWAIVYLLAATFSAVRPDDRTYGGHDGGWGWYPTTKPPCPTPAPCPPNPCNYCSVAKPCNNSNDTCPGPPRPQQNPSAYPCPVITEEPNPECNSILSSRDYFAIFKCAELAFNVQKALLLPIQGNYNVNRGLKCMCCKDAIKLYDQLQIGAFTLTVYEIDCFPYFGPGFTDRVDEALGIAGDCTCSCTDDPCPPDCNREWS